MWGDSTGARHVAYEVRNLYTAARRTEARSRSPNYTRAIPILGGATYTLV